MKKKYTFTLIAFILVNLLTYFLILPYEQKMANSHLSTEGIIFFTLSAILVLFAFFNFILKKDIKIFLILLVFAATLVFWGYKISLLECLICLRSG